MVEEPGPRDEACGGGCWGSVDSSKPPGPGLHGSRPAVQQLKQLGEVAVLGSCALPGLDLAFLLERAQASRPRIWQQLPRHSILTAAWSLFLVSLLWSCVGAIESSSGGGLLSGQDDALRCFGDSPPDDALSAPSPARSSAGSLVACRTRFDVRA